MSQKTLFPQYETIINLVCNQKSWHCCKVHNDFLNGFQMKIKGPPKISKMYENKNLQDVVFIL